MYPSGRTSSPVLLYDPCKVCKIPISSVQISAHSYSFVVYVVFWSYFDFAIIPVFLCKVVVPLQTPRLPSNIRRNIREESTVASSDRMPPKQCAYPNPFKITQTLPVGRGVFHRTIVHRQPLSLTDIISHRARHLYTIRYPVQQTSGQIRNCIPNLSTSGGITMIPREAEAKLKMLAE